MVGVSTLAGYGFVFLDPFKKVIFGVLMAALLIPSALVLIPAFLELRTMHLLNARLGLASSRLVPVYRSPPM